MNAARGNRDGRRHIPLRRRWWLNLALLLLVAAMALFIAHRSTTGPKDARPALTARDPASVQRVEVRMPRQPTVVLERRAGGWRMTAPIAARANGFAVDAVTQLLRAPIETRIGPASADSAGYGLEQPSLTVMLDDDVVTFGETHPFNDLHYARHGDAVYLVSSRLFAAAARPYTGFIDSRLLEEGRKPVALKLPGFALALTDGAWRRAPEDTALSSDRINAFVDEWRHARALDVRPAQAKPAKERVTITLEEPDGTRSTLHVDIAARRPQLILRRADEGLEYYLPAQATTHMLHLRADAPK